METRLLAAVKIYVLVLNNMYDCCEGGNIVAISSEYENLIKYYNDNLLTEPIRDNKGYLHSFKDGDLYFYNPCYSLEVGSVDAFGHGIHFEWCTEDILYSGKYFVV